MKKMLFFAAIALVALGSCTSDEFVGENNPNETNENYANAIVFGTGVKAVTRGTSTDAALLNNNFVFFGTKGTSHSTVFNNYQANFKDNSANTTESNSSNWEYVSYYNVPDGVTTTDGVTAFAASSTNTNKVAQTIKYWDYATEQYDFAAYSLGLGADADNDAETPNTYATASAINFANLGTNNQVFTLAGSADQLAACYISDLVTAYNKQAVVNNSDPENPTETSPKANDYGQPVQFKFRSLGTKIRIAFYETVPGYSVKDVKFYSIAKTAEDSDNPSSPTNTPTLFTSTAVLPSGSGTMKITYPTTGWGNKNETDYNKAHVSFTPTDNTADLSSTMSFGNLTNYPTTYEGALNSGNYIGRTSNTATYADGGVTSDGENPTFTPNTQGKYYTILPNENGANLQLRIKYTLQSTDGYGETITVDNATAVVPAELAKWNPNYAYTYIFKISDMTNGSTGEDGNGDIVTGLTPITLDAVVVNSEDGVQETITTVSKPSITTYAQGKVVTNNDEYIASVPVYIIVNNGTGNETLTDKVKLFTVTQTKGTNASANPAQTISEVSVDNAFVNDMDNEATTWSVTDANNWVLKLTESNLELVNVINAADSPTGNEISIGENQVAKFTPSTAGTIYAFQYEVEAATTKQITAADYNATLPGAISKDGNAYSFTSFGSNTGNPQYGTGIVKVVSQANGWTTVLVISNSVAGFVGNQYKVNATTMVANTYYELYTTGGSATGIYVLIANHTLTDEEVSTYNATLTGAVTSAQTRPVPGKYQYKIIKIAE